MRLPRFIRQWAAFVLVSRSDEIGGMLHDYKNGRWEELAKWNTEEEADQAMELIWHMMNHDHDEIYIACVKSAGFGRGYFLVFDTNGGEYRRDFWMGVYDPDEALVDVCKRARSIAKGMGYRDLEDTTGRIS